MRRIAILAVALALVAAACGDDDGSVLGSTTAPAETSTETTSPASDTTQAGGGETTTTEGGGEQPGGASSDAIQAALDNYENAALRLSYRFGDGPDETILTISQDPNREPPVSATLIGEDGEEGRFLTIGDTSIVCGPPGDECIQFPPEMGMDMGQALLGPMLSGLLLAEDLPSSPGFTVEQGTITIAGRDGYCFTFAPTGIAVGADVDSVRQCIDSEFGFILLFEATEAGGATEGVMELLEWGQPQPDDFEPSGPLTTMPTG